MFVIVCSAIIGWATGLALAEQPLESGAAHLLRIPASRIDSAVPDPVVVNSRVGVGPDEAAAIALYSNPALRAIRNRRGLAAAQLIQAGILPNPL
ncbi:MAG: hypothetical protein DMF47_06545, partial [Verrucomicrobia bacterium]